jgi:hypothetical protein
VKENRRKRGRKCRNWIARRKSLGASKCLFRELSSEDTQEYRKHVRISVEKFDELLRLVESYISTTDIVMKAAVPARLKLEFTLRFLASGDSFSSLALLFRIPPCTISKFLPETLQSIINTLDSFVNVCIDQIIVKLLTNTSFKKWESV